MGVRLGGMFLVLMLVGLRTALVGVLLGSAGLAVFGCVAVVVPMLVRMGVGMLVGMHRASMGVFVRMGVRVRM